MNNRIDRMKKEWDDRSTDLGIRKKAVLFKRFPTFLNYIIHRQHLRFIMDHLPAYPNTIMDAGCGYGRLSREIKQRHPHIAFQGVDFCDEFAREYKRNIGPCFCGPIEMFTCRDRFDMIFSVTLLMYLDHQGRKATIKKLWDLLNPGGVLISIEPAKEFNQMLARITGKANANPTGGEVGYFTASECKAYFEDLERVVILNERPIGLIGRSIAVHHALSILKRK